MTATTHLATININDEYETPVGLYDEFCSKVDIYPKLDVCTTPAMAKCPLFFTKEDDALKHPWNMDFFCNPPYSKVAKFVEYAYKQHKAHNVSAILLTYAKTDTRWWHEYVEGSAEPHFVRGRIPFLREGHVLHRCRRLNGIGCDKTYCQDEYTCHVCGNHMTALRAPYPSVWIVWRGED